MNDPILQLRRRGLAVNLTCLGMTMIAAYGVTIAVAGVLGLPAAYSAAGIAAVLCAAGAGLALVLEQCVASPEGGLPAMLLGMGARMGFPLVLGISIHLRGGPLAEAGFLYYLLVFYPVALAAETLLSLSTRRLARPQPNR